MLTEGSLEKELLDLILEVCQLSPEVVGEMGLDDNLVGEDSPLGLDSLDSVEVVVAVQKKYNIRIANQKEARKIVSSLRHLAGFVREKSP